MLWVSAAFHSLVTCWSPPNVNVTVQPVSAMLPVSVTVTLATNPPVHWLAVE